MMVFFLQVVNLGLKDDSVHSRDRKKVYPTF